MIDVSGVQHTYLKATPFESLALRGVDLQVRQGEVLGLVGATGSGKSTLLQHLNGLYRPHTGRVWVVEHDLSDPQVDLRLVRRLVGLLFQNPEDQLFEQFVGDDIAFGPRNLGLDRVAVRERVYEAMRQVGLDFEQFKDRQTFGLSGGQRRRVALAGVLAMKPLVLVLDEPTAGLDPASRTALLQQLRDLNRRHGLTIVISTHSMDDLAELANRIVVLAAGRVALEGPTRAVFAQVDRLVELSLGLPQAAQLAVELRLRGCAVPADLLTVDEAVRALRGLLSPTSSPSSPAVEGGRKRDNERI